MTDDIPHSGHYFGDQRDFWWNYDFLTLMAERWKLKDCRHVLDVGCGIGHWGQTISPFLDPSCKIIGIDRESQWVQNAQERANERNDKRFHYQKATAEAIPFEDNTFDMVTCQTVLIHVPDIAEVLKEMCRVLKPGGLLAVAEPNNIAPNLVFNNRNVDDPIDDVLNSVRFQMICERGKVNLGLGYNSAGDLLPYYFSKANLHDLQIYLSDKTSPMIPPYQSPEEKAQLEQMHQSKKIEMFIWPKEETKRYYLAGGGTLSDFEKEWADMLKNREVLESVLSQNALWSVGTCIMYLISGRK